MIRKKKLLIGMISVFMIGIMLYNKPLSRVINIESRTYGTPANSAFTDENFYKCIVDAYNETVASDNRVSYNTNLTDEQLKSVEILECGSSGKRVNSTNGLNKLENLRELKIGYGTFSSIDLQGNPLLSSLYINASELGTIDLTNNKQLESLTLYSTGLSELNLSENKLLKELDLANEQFTTLSLSNNTLLEKIRLSNILYLENLDLSHNILLKNLILSTVRPFTSLDLSYNTSLEELKLFETYVNIDNLDLTNNVNLKKLEINRNSGTLASKTLDLSHNTQLTDLIIVYSGVNNLDLSNNTNLKVLGLFEFNMSSLDITKNTMLEELQIGDNKLTNIDLSKNTNLKKLRLDKNIFENINLSNNTNLEYIYLSENNNLSEIDLGDNTKLSKIEIFNQTLSNLDISNNTNLKELIYRCSEISNLDISHNINLEYLELYDNNLSNIDLSSNTALKEIKITNNKLTNIDLSKNVNLKKIDLEKNELETINLNNNTKLVNLVLRNNKLNDINLNNNSELRTFNLSNNQLTKLNLYNNLKLTSWDISNNNFVSDLIFYKEKNLDVNFSKVLGSIIFPNNNPNVTALLLLSIETSNSCTEDTCSFENVGEYEVIGNYSRSGMNFSITYNINVIEATSDKYYIDAEKNYINTYTDSNNNTIFSNINITQIDGVSSVIENNKYIIKGNNNTIKEFDILNYSSNKYDLTKEYIKVNDNSIESLLNNISCTNCSAYVYDGENNLTTGNFGDNYTLRIMYNDELIKEYELKYSISGVELNKSDIKLNLDTNTTFQLSANITPTNAENKNVTWESSDPSIATVDENGLVTAKSYGETTITVKTEDGEFTDTCNVVVSEITTYTVIFKDGDNTYTSEFEENEDIVFKTDLNKTGYKLVGWKYNSQNYNLTDKLSMPSNDIELEAIWELVVPEIENYESDDNNITGISLKTNIDNLNLGIDSIYQVKVSKHDGSDKTSGLVGTGDKVKIYLDNQLVSEYDVIIKGDVTGTGTSTVSDVAKLYQYLKGKVTMDDCYIKAGNVVDSDSAIKVNDVAKLYQFIKGKINSL